MLRTPLCLTFHHGPPCFSHNLSLDCYHDYFLFPYLVLHIQFVKQWPVGAYTQNICSWYSLLKPCQSFLFYSEFRQNLTSPRAPTAWQTHPSNLGFWFTFSSSLNSLLAFVWALFSCCFLTWGYSFPEVHTKTPSFLQSFLLMSSLLKDIL